ncbi:hypothetical protein NLX62_01685 [Mycobacteriaceae bacterium Msp059]|nr:hypothetical protein [Mycobacteriaceae bacterium Msp059]
MWASLFANLNDIGVVGIVVLMSGAFVVSLVRGWLVPGRYHREVIADRDAEIVSLRGALEKAANSNNILTRTLLEKNSNDDTTARLLVAFRAAVEGASS